MSIGWQKELESGIPALDYQHLKIFETIDTLLQKCGSGSSPEEIFEVFEEIDNYAKRHFSYEENLQDINKYPGLTSQREHHGLFLKELDELKTKLAADGPGKGIAIAAKGRLIRWWVQHIKNLDGKFIDFLKSKHS